LEALYYERINGNVRCFLCPHNCLIADDKTGICKVRKNQGGKLITETWGRISSMHKDPIEKKPLYHFFPGSTILSIGSVGCNMKCRCCQNWQISQVSASEFGFEREFSPAEIVRMALSDKDNVGIAFTYNEPAIWFEYMLAIARLNHRENLQNVMVSNGYISEKPLDDLLSCIDAFNIDLKGFNDSFYRSFTGATLAPVLGTLKKIRASGRHLEITCLVIPGRNDSPVDFDRLTSWIADELGANTILHLSQYHPAYKYSLEPTSESDLEKLLSIAGKKLYHVYAGNVQMRNYQDTRCPECRNMVIRRTGYHTSKIALTADGCCQHCGKQIIIC
jgi:pyruvate formate lyase activating enzyme